MSYRFARFIFLLGSIVLVSVCSAENPVQVDITRGAAKYNLGLSSFVVTGAGGEMLAATFQTVLAQDLRFARLFNLVQNGPQVKSNDDVKEWIPLGMELVLAGTFRQNSGGKVDLFPRLYDVKASKEVLNIKIKNPTNDPRLLAHQVANEVVQYFTGLPGIFSSKIVFSNSVSGKKELYVSDYDGQNSKRLTNDNSIVLLPRVSPDGSVVLFTSYSRGNPDLYIMNMDGAARRRLSSKPGLNVSPSWAPNGQQLIATLSVDGPPNLYLLDLQGNIVRRVTEGAWADTAPCFSPDGNQLVFTSDRAGPPHIFIMNLDGTGLRRMTTLGHCDSAAWSPDGQIIVFTKAEPGNRFDLYSIEVLTGVERRLTWGPKDNENPSWSPDGRFILFVSNRRGKKELFTMLADGSDQLPLGPTKGQYYTPYWSRALQ